MKENFLTNDILHDFYVNLDYKKLSPKEEIKYIKRAKLSFYDDDDAFKELYLKYYFEEFPRFQKEYEIASDEDKEKLLNEAIENSRYYRDEFLMNNQRLVFFVAKDYLHYKRDSLTLMDMIQEGNVGLMRAVKKFDVEMGYRFSTYAIDWIRQTITRAFADSDKMVRIPVHTYTKKRQLLAIIGDMTDENGKQPTDKELASITGLPLGKVKLLREYLQNEDNIASLDMPVGEEEDSILSDHIESGERPFSEIVEEKLMYQEFRNLLEKSSLKEHHKEVLRLRYGLSDGETHTLEEIANIYGVTRERIRQIEQSSLMKLRRDANIVTFNKENKSTKK